LIEDCNNTISGYFRNKKIGTFGDFAILSFYANRYLSTCDGGAIVINNKNLLDPNKLKSFLKYGVDIKAFRLANGEINANSDVSTIGINGQLSNVHCAVGVSQLSELTNKKNIVNRNFHTYENLISDEFKINIRQDVKIFPWVYLIKIKKDANNALAYLKGRGIKCSYLHFFNHSYSGFESYNFVNLHERNIIALPVGWWVNKSDIVEISTVVNQIKG
jgi:perosamine synthetase